MNEPLILKLIGFLIPCLTFAIYYHRDNVKVFLSSIILLLYDGLIASLIIIQAVFLLIWGSLAIYVTGLSNLFNDSPPNTFEYTFALNYSIGSGIFLFSFLVVFFVYVGYRSILDILQIYKGYF